MTDSATAVVVVAAVDVVVTLGTAEVEVVEEAVVTVTGTVCGQTCVSPTKIGVENSAGKRTAGVGARLDALVNPSTVRLAAHAPTTARLKMSVRSFTPEPISGPRPRARCSEV